MKISARLALLSLSVSAFPYAAYADAPKTPWVYGIDERQQAEADTNNPWVVAYADEAQTTGVGRPRAPRPTPAPAPAPAPPPPPPPARAKQFIVFFGFDRCDITPEADKVLGEAAQAAKTQGSAAVTIVGHTDTMGSNEYNQRLSECRANAAKTNLVDKGIGAGSISTSGRGESLLLVKTGDSVKEPQNRRATIDLNK